MKESKRVSILLLSCYNQTENVVPGPGPVVKKESNIVIMGAVEGNV